MAYECKFCTKPNRTGTGKSAHERNCPKNPAHVPTLREQLAAQQAANPNNRCPECEAVGTPRGFPSHGALTSHRVKSHGYINPFSSKGRQQGRQAPQALEVVATNGMAPPTPATVRRSLQHQHRNRSDLATIVKIAFPGGIPTEDVEVLDSNLGYVFQTAQILERR